MTSPGVVKESLKKAHDSPEAAANTEAVEEKKQVEDELQQKVPITESAGEPAPTTSAETTATAPAVTNNVSAEVSPMTTSAPPSQPTVTTGVREAETSKVSAPDKPASSVPATSTAEDTKEKKKKNRASGFFSRLRERFR